MFKTAINVVCLLLISVSTSKSTNIIFILAEKFTDAFKCFYNRFQVDKIKHEDNKSTEYHLFHAYKFHEFIPVLVDSEKVTCKGNVTSSFIGL